MGWQIAAEEGEGGVRKLGYRMSINGLNRVPQADAMYVPGVTAGGVFIPVAVAAAAAAAVADDGDSGGGGVSPGYAAAAAAAAGAQEPSR